MKALESRVSRLSVYLLAFVVGVAAATSTTLWLAGDKTSGSRSSKSTAARQVTEYLVPPNPKWGSHSWMQLVDHTLSLSTFSTLEEIERLDALRVLTSDQQAYFQALFAHLSEKTPLMGLEWAASHGWPRATINELSSLVTSAMREDSNRAKALVQQLPVGLLRRSGEMAVARSLIENNPREAYHIAQGTDNRTAAMISLATGLANRKGFSTALVLLC